MNIVIFVLAVIGGVAVVDSVNSGNLTLPTISTSATTNQ